jgi:hypothetical protein
MFRQPFPKTDFCYGLQDLPTRTDMRLIRSIRPILSLV